MSSHGRWDDYDIIIMIIVTIKQGRFKCIKCMNKGDKLYDVPTFYMKFLKYDLFWHWIKGICHVQLENNLVGLKVQGAFDAMDYNFTSTLGCYSKLVWNKCVAKTLWNWRHKMRLVNQYNASLTTMGQIPPKVLVMVKKQITPRICAIWHGMWPWAIWEQSCNNCENPFAEFSRWKLF